ncbi:MAG: sugar ABC transporter permease [Gaiellaceae bacterium]
MSAGVAEPTVEPNAFRRGLDNIRSGDVGSLPVIAGLILITIFFQSKNDNFLSAGNINNLMVQMAGVTLIAMGVVFVLLIGEIDLSIGFLSGVAGVVAAKLQIPDGSWQANGIVAILIAIAVGAAIGAFQGSFVALIGVPSFVVTLAGLLAWQGVVQKVIGVQGVIPIEDKWINDTANYFFSDRTGWILAAAASLFFAATALGKVLGRRRHGLEAGNLPLALARVLAFTGVAFFVVAVSNRDRGFPFAGFLIVVLLVFWTYVATRTTFGRHVYAVGGNAEAARRAGINVARIRITVFAISGGMAGLGGVILASRLASVDLNAGGGTLLLDAISAAVIGGTSLFGGRGRVVAALLGALVIATIANGIDLVGYSSATKFIVTGAILLAAVTLDTLSRRRLAKSGR